MILDGQNILSDLSAGDLAANWVVGDNPSGNVIDQQVKGGPFSEGGSAYLGLFAIVRNIVALASSGGGTVQAVIQDSPDNVTFTDRVVGAVIAAADAKAGTDLLNVRMPLTPKLARYVRIVYRVATAVFQSGKVISYLTPDEDAFDLSQRKDAVVVSEPTGALDESTDNGVFSS